MARRRILALAAVCGLALIVLPAPAAPAQTAPPGGTTSTAAAGGTTSTAGAGGKTGTAAASGTTSTAASGGTTSTAASGGTSATPAPKTTTGAAPTPAMPAKPAAGAPATSTVTVTVSAATDGTPVGIILLAILGGLLLVIGLFVLLARFMGWDPDWWERTKQTWREAGYQTENAISEFGDWTRLGR